MTLQAVGQSSRRKSDVVVRREFCPDTLASIYRLRAAVWRAQCDVGDAFDDSWFDNCDNHALHWSATHDGRIVAGARLCVHHDLVSTPDWKIFSGLGLRDLAPAACMGRLVVQEDYRSLGISHEMDALRVDAASAAGCRAILATVSDVSGAARLRSLQAIGFVAVAPPFSIRDWDCDLVTPLVKWLD